MDKMIPKLSVACYAVTFMCHLKRKLSDLHKSMFKRLEILTLSSEYIFSLMNFIVNNQEHFQINSTIRGVNTRNKNSLIDQMPTSLVFRRVLIMLESKFYISLFTQVCPSSVTACA
jgi:hypothetical protein